jgi:hypothetical protein
MRTFGIWVFGLLASAIVGAIVGSHFDDIVHPRDMGFWGALASMLGFACLRLWFGQSPKISN